jgi:hypothetical protein
VFSVEELQEQEVPAVMEKELVQVSDILKEAYTRIEKLDLKCRNAVVAACYLEQVQLVLAHTLGGYSKTKHSKRQENAMFAICKVLKNSIKQYIPWKQFLYYCDQDDKIEAFLEFANKLEWKNKDNGV